MSDGLNIAETISGVRDKDIIGRTDDPEVTAHLIQAAEILWPQVEHFGDHEAGEVGIELETMLVETEGVRPVDQRVRDGVIGDPISPDDGFVKDKELGAGQIEMKHRADSLLHWRTTGIDEGVGWFMRVEEIIRESVHTRGGQTMSVGIHPTGNPARVRRTDNEKFRQVPGHHDDNVIPQALEELRQTVGGGVTDFEAAAVGLTQALQLNISMPNLETAIKANNRIYQISPAIIALSGNSRFVGGRDTGMNDPWNKIWDLTHRTEAGQRVFLRDEGFYTEDGLDTPEGKKRAFLEVMGQMSKFPLILNPQDHHQALQMATGMNWQAGKMKFLMDEEGQKLQKILVECRAPAVQLTPEENAALSFMIMGRLRLSLEKGEPLQDFDTVRRNTDIAMVGLEGSPLLVNAFDEVEGTWTEVRASGEGLRLQEIRHAALGLALQGDGSFNWQKFDEARAFLSKHIKVKTPSERLAELIGDDWKGLPQKELDRLFAQRMRDGGFIR